MSRSVPWDAIPTPTADLSVLRVAGTTGVAIFWGRDAGAQCLLIIELDGDHTAQFRRDVVFLHGILQKHARCSLLTPEYRRVGR